MIGKDGPVVGVIAGVVDAIVHRVAQDPPPTAAPSGTADAKAGGPAAGGGAGDAAENRATTGAIDASKGLRDLAKWLLGIFAAIAVILTAGIQLSSIGHLSGGSLRFWVAIGGIALALLSVGGMVWFVVQVLVVNAVTLNQLVREEGKRRSALMDFIRDGGFLEAGYPTVRKMRDEARTQFAPGAKPSLVGPLIRPMLAGASYFLLRSRFQRAVIAMFAFAITAAVGICFFAWAANPQPSAKAGLFQAPTEAYVALSEGGKAMLTDSLGKECVASEVHVILLSSTDTTAEAVSIPTDDKRCKAAKFTVGSSILGANGYVRPASPVAQPTKLPTGPSGSPSPAETPPATPTIAPTR